MHQFPRMTLFYVVKALPLSTAQRTCSLFILTHFGNPQLVCLLVCVENADCIVKLLILAVHSAGDPKTATNSRVIEGKSMSPAPPL